MVLVQLYKNVIEGASGYQIQLLEYSKTVLLLLLLLRNTQGTPTYVGNQAWYQSSAGVKTTGKILNNKI